MVRALVALGIAVSAVVVLGCLWWVGWRICRCMQAKQVFATLEEILVENRKGLKKDVVRGFPVVKTSDLNGDSSSKLQCPICWLAFRNEETLRQLPHCGHVFHRHCVDPVLEQQVLCPVCGTVLTDSPTALEEERAGESPAPRRGLHAAPASPTPPWVLVNRPMPLPLANRSSSSDRFEIELGSGESPLLRHVDERHDWSAADLEHEQKCIDISFTLGTDIPVEKRQPSYSSSTEVDSFSFSTSATVQETAPPPSVWLQLRRSRESFSSDSSPSSARFSRSSRTTSCSSGSSFQKLASWEHPHLANVAEHLPLTRPPEQCSFDVLPVITGSGSSGVRDCTRVGANRNTYSQL